MPNQLDLDKKRLDQALAKLHPELSRAYISKQIIDGRASVNGVVITKTGHIVSGSDKLILNLPLPSNVEDISIPIIYEDDDLLVIDKPQGILTHAKGDHTNEATVATWLAKHLVKHPTTNKDGIVHRLDRATSGVMVLAKDEETQRFLQKQFSQRKVKKTYIAAIQGVIDPSEAMIDLPIERNPKKPQSFRVGANGKQAQTAYKVLKTSHDVSVIELTPKTGRTHQLRVHLQYLKHPIIGDNFYGGRPADRLYLHAHKLEFTLPGSTRREFTSPIPKEFNIVTT